ncbi:hypothetical protein GQ55_7G145200 [Panicum hallii var. hallii]|uniref:Uncharacterized protein n=1 Tax=Panicum hallii var. hallii TaxID=1504633 RepID=A0A2T7CV47_9POAL|nr:hypothetical protein GQ55_7G145200 [Panicum hallii var. hallii]
MPTALRHSILPLPDSLSRPNHLRRHKSIIYFLHRNNVTSQRKRKDHPRTIGMGGTRKT